MNLTEELEENYHSMEQEAILIRDLVGCWLHLAGQHLWVYEVPNSD
jgi:hypothetical protein